VCCKGCEQFGPTAPQSGGAKRASSQSAYTQRWSTLSPCTQPRCGPEMPRASQHICALLHRVQRRVAIRARVQDHLSRGGDGSGGATSARVPSLDEVENLFQDDGAQAGESRQYASPQCRQNDQGPNTTTPPIRMVGMAEPIKRIRKGGLSRLSSPA